MIARDRRHRRSLEIEDNTYDGATEKYLGVGDERIEKACDRGTPESNFTAEPRKVIISSGINATALGTSFIVQVSISEARKT